MFVNSELDNPRSTATAGKVEYHDANSSQYVYSEIDGTQIRAICVKSEEQRHVGSLVTLERNAGQYNALSYAWGTPTPDPDRKIFILNDGETQGYVPLTKNLDHALADIRNSAINPKVFFIDQISINQNDNNEKSIQVAKMGDVYRYAKQVVTYLGPEEDGDDRATQLLQRIIDHVQPVIEILEAFGGITMEVIDLFVRRNEIPNLMYEIAESEIADYRHLERFIYDNGWTQRLWMCQENLLNENLVFLKGSRSIDRRSVLMFPIAQTLGLIFPLPRNEGPTFTQAIAMAVENNEMHKKKTTRSFFHLVNSYGANLGCSNPKDKIYGLLGLARDTWGITPDYAADHQDVFVDFVLKSIERTQTMRIFNYVFQVGTELQRSDMYTSKDVWPSWAPTFEKQSSEAFVSLAAGSTIPRVKLTTLPASFEMEVQGFQVATIKTIVGIFDEHSSPLQMTTPFDTLCSTINIIEATRDILAPVQSNESDRALCFTLTNGGSTPISGQIEESWVADAPLALRLVLDAMRRARDNWTQEQFVAPVLTSYLDEKNATLANSLISALELRHRSMCVTRCDRPLLTTTAVRAGDIVTILLGGGEAYILRPQDSGTYLLLGPAFIYDYMSAQSILDDAWEEELRKALITIITGAEQPHDIDLEVTAQFRGTMQKYFTYFVGVLYVSRHTYIYEHGTNKGTDELTAGTRQFIASEPTVQRQVIRRAISHGPFDVHINTFWRQNFWESIQKLIEYNLLCSPPWEARLKTFNLR